MQHCQDITSIGPQHFLKFCHDSTPNMATIAPQIGPIWYLKLGYYTTSNCTKILSRIEPE